MKLLARAAREYCLPCEPETPSIHPEDFILKQETPTQTEALKQAQNRLSARCAVLSEDLDLLSGYAAGNFSPLRSIVALTWIDDSSLNGKALFSARERVNCR